MAIRTGDTAPAFELPCKPGETVNVGAHIGSEPVVLLFFPLAFSPVCTDEMCAMRDDWAAWNALDARVFGLTADSPFITDKFRADLELPLPILSDFNRDVARSWGVLHEDLFGMRDVPKRACFVIAADGTVAYDWVSDDPGRMPELAAVRAALEAARVGA